MGFRGSTNGAFNQRFRRDHRVVPAQVSQAGRALRGADLLEELHIGPHVLGPLVRDVVRVVHAGRGNGVGHPSAI
jgi:hypothetical protein